MAEDLALQLAQRQSMINSSLQSKGKSGFIGPIPLEWNASNGTSLAAAAPLGKTIPGLLKTGKEGGLGDKFLKAVVAAAEECGKMAQNAGVLYSGDVPSGSIHNGSSHVSAVSMSSSDDFSRMT